MTAAQEARFGKGQWVLDSAGTSPYLNHDVIREKQLDYAEVERVAARALSSAPHVLRVYTRAQPFLGRVPPTQLPATDTSDGEIPRAYSALASRSTLTWRAFPCRHQTGGPLDRRELGSQEIGSEIVERLLGKPFAAQPQLEYRTLEALKRSSSADSPRYCQMALTTGMLMSGRTSVGIQ
jgi:hypothetical protein